MEHIIINVFNPPLHVLELLFQARTGLWDVSNIYETSSVYYLNVLSREISIEIPLLLFIYVHKA